MPRSTRSVKQDRNVEGASASVSMKKVVQKSPSISRNQLKRSVTNPNSPQTSGRTSSRLRKNPGLSLNTKLSESRQNQSEEVLNKGNKHQNQLSSGGSYKSPSLKHRQPTRDTTASDMEKNDRYTRDNVTEIHNIGANKEEKVQAKTDCTTTTRDDNISSQVDDESFSATDIDQDSFLNLSQDGDVQCEVKWDYRSKDTIKDIMKYKGQYSKEAVKKMVANFAHLHRKETPAEHSIKPMGLSLFSGERLGILSNEDGITKSKERMAKKRQERVRRRDGVREMINFLLNDLAKKQKSDNERNAEKSREYETKGTCVTELAMEEKASSHSQATEAGYKKPDLALLENVDDLFSDDDDLFANDSFVIEATQNPEKFYNPPSGNIVGNNQQNTNSLKTGCDNSGDKTASKVIETSGSSERKKFTFSKNPPTFNASKPAAVNTRPSSSNIVSNCDRSYVIPSSLQSNISKPGANSLSNKPSVLPTRPSTIVYAPKTSGYGQKCSSSVNSFANKYQQSSSSGSDQALGKTTFKKHNSFQGSSQSNRNPGHTIIIPKTNYNNNLSQNKTSFRKTLSFDSSPTCQSSNLWPSSSKSSHMPPSASSSRSETFPKPKSPASSTYTNSSSSWVSTAFTSATNPKPNQHALSSDSKKTDTKSSSTTNCAESKCSDSDDSLFDLPDDIILQLTDTDVIMDSQAAAISTAPQKLPAKNDTSSNLSKPSTGSCLNKQTLLGKSNNTNRPVGKNGFNSNPHNKAQIAVNNAPKSNCQKSLESQASKTVAQPMKVVNRQNLQNSILSPVKQEHQPMQNLGSPMQAFFKRSFSLQKSSPNGSLGSKHPQNSTLSSSTPVKQPKVDNSSSLKSAGCSDSFLEGVFNDSFMGDDALFETQILPMLEHVESQSVVAPEPKPTEMISPIKCSPEQIEQKRQAALQRRSLRLSQNQ